MQTSNAPPKPRQEGTAVIAAGNTTIAVVTTLGAAPVSVVVTPEANPGAGGCWVTGIGSGGFTINIAGVLGANLSVFWVASL